MGPLYALISAILFSATNILARTGAEEVKVDKYIGQFLTVLINMIIILAILIVYLLFSGYTPLTWTAVKYMILAGIFSAFLGRLLLFVAVEMIGSSRLGSLKMTTHFFTVVLGVFILNETLPLLGWIGVVVLFSGVTIVSQDTKRAGNKLAVEKMLIEEAAKGGRQRNLVIYGILFALTCGLSYGIGNIFRKLAMIHYPDPIMALTISSLAALIMITLFVVIRGDGRQIRRQLPLIMKGSYFWLGLSSSFAQIAVFAAFIYSPAVLVSSIAASETLFTLVWAYLILGKKELLTRQTVIGSLIVTLGVVMLVIFRG